MGIKMNISDIYYNDYLSKKLQPIHVDVLSNVGSGKEYYYPFNDDGSRLNYSNITKYLSRLGYIYCEYLDVFFKLDKYEGVYNPTNQLTLTTEIYKLIKYCNPTYNIETKHISSIFLEFKASYNTTYLEDEFSKFLETEDGMDYDVGVMNENSRLIQLRNGIFRSFCESDGYPFKLLPNSGLYFPSENDVSYDLFFKPISESEIFNELEYDDFLTILGDDMTLKFFLWYCGCVLFSYPFKKQVFLLLYGPGGTGKTALANSLGSIMGKSVSHANLSCLLDQKGKSCLIGKRLNVTSELEGKFDKRLTSALKELCDGNLIQVEQKYQAPTEIYPPAFIFTGNTFPDIDTSDTGIYRRACVINCTTNLEGTGVNWPALMTDNDHKNWLFNASYYVWKNNIDKIANDLKSESMKEIQSRMFLSNSFITWIEFYFGTIDRDKVRDLIEGKTLQVLYDNYDNYIRNYNGKPMIRTKFNEKIQNDYNLVYVPIHGMRIYKKK